MRPSLFFTTSLSLSPHFLLHSSRVVRGLSSASSSTALHSISRSNDGTVIISPKDEAQHSATVVLCHGLGDTANGWVEPTQYLANQLPHVKWILPTAPTQPVTLNMGMSMPSWYDIVGLDSRSSEHCNGLDESMERILRFVENEVSGVDSSTTSLACVSPLDYSRIVLAGFSKEGHWHCTLE